MNIDLNLQDLYYTLSSLNSSVESISNAANYFLEHGKEMNVCQILCGEWYNQFQMQKIVQDGEKYVFLLMCVAQEVLKKRHLNTDVQAKALSEQFKKNISKALSSISDFSKESKKQLIDLLDTWAVHNILEQDFIDSLKKSIDPQQYIFLSSQTNYPPPAYLINFAKNLKELQTRQKKVQEYKDVLTKIGQLSSKKDKQDEKKELLAHNIDGLQKALESEQKYRSMLLKDSVEMLKDLDRQNIKGVICLKHMQSRIDDLKKAKLSKDTQQRVEQ